MRNKLVWVGSVITVLYLVGITWLIWDRLPQLQTKDLNELGDFLAGAFGPIAFLWLVLGFLQQGEELRQGTEALLLQADELKRSVEQQSIMAAAATQQIESQRMALDLQKLEMERSISPSFRFEAGMRSVGGDGLIETSTTIINSGHDAADVTVLFEPPIGEGTQFRLGNLMPGGTQKIGFRFQSSEEEIKGTCTVGSLRMDGYKLSERYRYRIPAGNPFVIIERILPQVSDQPSSHTGFMAK